MSNAAKAQAPIPAPMPEYTEEAFQHAKAKVVLFRKYIREGRSVKQARALAGLIPLEDPGPRRKAA
jgi:hypothetical protein